MATEDFKESLNSCLVHHTRDWAGNKRDAWIWGIVVGWDEGSLAELSVDFGWDEETIERLGRLHKKFEEAV
jgi:hypothetical protein